MPLRRWRVIVVGSPFRLVTPRSLPVVIGSILAFAMTRSPLLAPSRIILAEKSLMGTDAVQQAAVGNTITLACVVPRTVAEVGQTGRLRKDIRQSAG